MKKFLITERQLEMVINENPEPVVKGIGLKITDEKGEYYKSIVKNFSSEDEFNNWKNKLKEGISIIGVMDIESDTKGVVKEEIDFDDKNYSYTIKLLTRMLQLKYPYILRIIPQRVVNGSLLTINIEFDLNKFYDVTNIKPGFDYDLDYLPTPSPYLFSFVDFRDDSRVNQFGFVFNDKIEEYLKRLNSSQSFKNRIKAYDGLSDEQLHDISLDFGTRIEYLRRWKEEGDSVSFTITDWVPKLNLTDYQEKFGRIDESITPRLRRLDDLRDIILFQTEIQDPCNFEDSDDYASFCINEGMQFFFGDTNYESENKIYMSDYTYDERQAIEDLMFDELYDKLKYAWAENFNPEDCQ